MIVNIKNISRNQFKRLNFYPCSDSPTRESHAYISIYGSEPADLPRPRIRYEIWHSGIQLQFDDISSPFRDLKMITENQANEIFQFAKKIYHSPKNLSLIVHCQAGVSRSAAVAKFVNDAFRLGFPIEHQVRAYNPLVYQMLVAAMEKDDEILFV